MFQYLKGAIEACGQGHDLPAPVHFQYLKGAIEALPVAVEADELIFQYLKGAIEARVSDHWVQCLYPFNTSKVQLKLEFARAPVQSVSTFNTSKVQLKLRARAGGLLGRASFNTSKVQLKQDGSEALRIGVAFNTSKVQLKPRLRASRHRAGVRFQYLKGAIEA